MWAATLLFLTGVWEFLKSIPLPVYAVGGAFLLGFVAGCHGCR